jgi:hypothetical protein
MAARFQTWNYPIPSNIAELNRGRRTGVLTLSQWQMDINNNGDRHGIMVAGHGIIFGNVADEINAGRVAGVEWREVRLEFERLAASRLDFRRCCGLPMFPAYNALR